MSYIDQLRKEKESGTVDAPVYNRTNRRFVDINLGSGSNLEVLYYDMEDIDEDNIDTVTLVEGEKRTILCDEDVSLLFEMDIL